METSNAKPLETREQQRFAQTRCEITAQNSFSPEARSAAISQPFTQTAATPIIENSSAAPRPAAE
jgi:hypothetical protein